MNIEEVRQYCLSKPLATEDTAFGPEGILFRIYNKIFAYLDLERPDLVVVKCDADYAIELRDKYNGILPAWHWNKSIGTNCTSTPTCPTNSSSDSSTTHSRRY